MILVFEWLMLWNIVNFCDFQLDFLSDKHIFFFVGCRPPEVVVDHTGQQERHGMLTTKDQWPFQEPKLQVQGL